MVVEPPLIEVHVTERDNRSIVVRECLFRDVEAAVACEMGN